MYLKSGVKRDGTFMRTRCISGQFRAYAAFKPGGLINGYNQAAGPYRVPHCQIASTFVYTNTILRLHAGSRRAAGRVRPGVPH